MKRLSGLGSSCPFILSLLELFSFLNISETDKLEELKKGMAKKRKALATPGTQKRCKVGEAASKSLSARVSSATVELCHYVIIFANMIRTIRADIVEAQKKCEETETVAAEARSVMATSEAEVKRLKEALGSAKNELALEKKKRRAAEAKIADAEKEMEGKIVEAGRLMVEAFQGSKEFSTEKIQFSIEAFIAGQEGCRQKVSARYPDLNFSFLDKGEPNDDQQTLDLAVIEEQPQLDPMTEKAPVIASAKVGLLLIEGDHLEAFEKNVDQVERKVAKAKQKFLKIKRSYDESLIEIKCLRSTIWKDTKAHAVKRSRLADEWKRLAKVAKERTWGAAVKIARYRIELRSAQERISTLERYINSLKIADEVKWGIAKKVGLLRYELYTA
ncbi:hypothetical protein COCNU_16G000250 [Cocos nucifera]|uniref:Uncharacterized protein n=1 Tax=Cocos nucifera TaxID=13894 RepID=A0A8K0IXJ4_COCNU|nr:hypothetical protein COCNU_16G000250 [Cocos nucifera]